MKHLFELLLVFFLLIFIFSCSRANDEQTLANPISNNTVKDINEVQVFLGNAPGVAEFKSRCITCHSLRYIQMQPDFPKKTWEKIVDKMIKNFHAPISDSSAKVIVQYLAEVKGRGIKY